MIFLFSILRDFRGAASLYLNYTIMQLGGARHLLFENTFYSVWPHGSHESLHTSAYDQPIRNLKKRARKISTCLCLSFTCYVLIGTIAAICITRCYMPWDYMN